MDKGEPIKTGSYQPTMSPDNSTKNVGGGGMREIDLDDTNGTKR